MSHPIPSNSAVLNTRRVMIIDDHPIIQECFSEILNRQEDLEVCGVATDIPDALEVIESSRPDLALVDITLRESSGLDLIKTIKTRYPDSRTMAFSMHDDTLYAERAISAGARGYINKQEPTPTLLAAIRQVLDGQIHLSEKVKQRILQRSHHPSEVPEETGVSQLSDRELQIFELIGTGLTTSEIAQRLNRSIHTINTHRQRIKSKLVLSNTAELARAAAQWILESNSRLGGTHEADYQPPPSGSPGP